ncbi:hypothetical protein V1477_002551 [Vespula maculifrons]|uniref:Uncharacterized protein n=1 Tax=Vespula maculifrons TaxID=7453 RepID=A0ABD2CX58_VESMC
MEESASARSELRVTYRSIVRTNGRLENSGIYLPIRLLRAIEKGKGRTRDLAKFAAGRRANPTGLHGPVQNKV